MLNNAELLAKYKEEKDLVCQGDPLEEHRFPTFRAWKVDYVREYLETHQTVSVELADKIMEAAQTEADVELLLATISSKEKDMTDETTTVTEPTEAAVTGTVNATETAAETAAETPTEAPKAAAKGKGKKATTKKAAAKPAAAPKPESKMSKARKIFEKYYGKKTRAEVIKLFISDAGCTANGAATYYQKMKSELPA